LSRKEIKITAHKSHFVDMDALSSRNAVLELFATGQVIACSLQEVRQVSAAHLRVRARALR
jgi:hypothetical protein